MEHVIVTVCVHALVWERARFGRAIFASTCSLLFCFFYFFYALPLAFLMQHRTLSPGLRGDLIISLSLSLSLLLARFSCPRREKENQLRRCCHRSGEVCFPSTFICGTSPSTVTVETRATPTLFPSTSSSFNDLSYLLSSSYSSLSLLFFFLFLKNICCTAPSLPKPCGIGEKKQLYKKCETKGERVRTPELWRCTPTSKRVFLYLYFFGGGVARLSAPVLRG